MQKRYKLIFQANVIVKKKKNYLTRIKWRETTRFQDHVRPNNIRPVVLRRSEMAYNKYDTTE